MYPLLLFCRHSGKCLLLRSAIVGRFFLSLRTPFSFFLSLRNLFLDEVKREPLFLFLLSLRGSAFVFCDRGNLSFKEEILRKDGSGWQKGGSLCTPFLFLVIAHSFPWRSQAGAALFIFIVIARRRVFRRRSNLVVKKARLLRHSTLFRSSQWQKGLSLRTSFFFFRHCEAVPLSFTAVAISSLILLYYSL